MEFASFTLLEGSDLIDTRTLERTRTTLVRIVAATLSAEETGLPPLPGHHPSL